MKNEREFNLKERRTPQIVHTSILRSRSEGTRWNTSFVFWLEASLSLLLLYSVMSCDPRALPACSVNDLGSLAFALCSLFVCRCVPKTLSELMA
jgi:hypothetical protein